MLPLNRVECGQCQSAQWGVDVLTGWAIFLRGKSNSKGSVQRNITPKNPAISPPYTFFLLNGDMELNRD